LLETPRRRDIVFAGGLIAAGMIMDEDDRGRIMLERAAEDGSGVNCEMGQRSLLHRFIGNQPVTGIEE